MASRRALAWRIRHPSASASGRVLVARSPQLTSNDFLALREAHNIKMTISLYKRLVLLTKTTFITHYITVKVKTDLSLNSSIFKLTLPIAF